MSVVEKFHALHRAKELEVRALDDHNRIERKFGVDSDEAEESFDRTIDQATARFEQAEQELAEVDCATVFDVLVKAHGLLDDNMLPETLDRVRADLAAAIVPPEHTFDGYLKMPFGVFDEPESFAEAYALYLHADHYSMEALEGADSALEEFGANSPQHAYARRTARLATTSFQWALAALRMARPTNSTEAVQKLSALMGVGLEDNLITDLKAEALSVAGGES